MLEILFLGEPKLLEIIGLQNLNSTALKRRGKRIDLYQRW